MKTKDVNLICFGSNIHTTSILFSQFNSIENRKIITLKIGINVFQNAISWKMSRIFPTISRLIRFEKRFNFDMEMSDIFQLKSCYIFYLKIWIIDLKFEAWTGQNRQDDQSKTFNFTLKMRKNVKKSKEKISRDLVAGCSAPLGAYARGSLSFHAHAHLWAMWILSL